MLLHEIVGFAHGLAKHVPDSSTEVSAEFESAISDYWAAAKCRSQRWQDELGRLEKEMRHDDEHHANAWNASGATIVEILFADAVTAVWTARLFQREPTYKSEPTINPLAESVFDSDREARQRAVVMLDREFDYNLRRRKSIAILPVLSKARKQAETWTDLFLGYIGDSPSILKCGIIAKRVQQNAENIRRLRQGQSLTALDQRVSDEIKRFFRELPLRTTGNADLNRRICAAIRTAQAALKPTVSTGVA